MKLKDFFSAIVENKKNGQLNVSFRKNKLKEEGISVKELLNAKMGSGKIKFEDFE